MARRERHRRGGRVTPKGTRPRHQEHRPRAADGTWEPDLLAEVHERLATGEPVDLLAGVSSIVAALDPRSRSPLERSEQDSAAPTLDDLVRSFGEVDLPETTALLAGIAVLAPDALVRGRARRYVQGRRHPMPAWLAGLGSARAGRTVEMTHVLGDGDDVMAEIELPRATGTARALSVVVYVDHNLASVAKDGFVVPGPLDDLVALMKAQSDVPSDTTWREVSPADARARITEAVDHGALFFPPLETDTWPACRPIVEWAARMLPTGGRGYERPVWDDDAKARLTEAFFASPQGAALEDPDHRELFESILWFATDYGPGDPLRWSPTAVEILLGDWIPRKIVAPADFLAKAPEVLRAFVAYAHHERGIRPGLTAETLEAVDDFEPDYQRTIRSPRPQGAAALLAAMGALDPDGPWDLTDDLDLDDLTDDLGDLDDLDDLGDLGDLDLDDLAEVMLEILRRAVGGDDALWALDDRPLPHEAFAWDGIDADVVGKVGEVLAACDRCCDELLDVEYRTACRRYLAKVARAAPGVLRRRGRADTAAAAVCWTVGKANELFSPSGGGMRVKDLVEHFDLAQGSVSQRAATLMRAAGVGPAYGRYAAWDVSLGDPGLLVSLRRRRIIELRDRYGGD